MKATFKQFLSEDADDSRVAKNWICADMVFVSLPRTKKAFHQFMKLNNSKTPYYDFIVSEDDDAEVDFKREVFEYLNGFTFKNDVIIKSKGGLMIESYKELLSVSPPKAILDSGKSFTIDCFEKIDIKVEPWWPQEMTKFVINGNGNAINVSLTGISDVVKSCYIMEFNSTVTVSGGVLGLLKIRDLGTVDFMDLGFHRKRGGPVSNSGKTDDLSPAGIISKYLPLGNILDCIDELEDAGYGEYAKL